MIGFLLGWALGAAGESRSSHEPFSKPLRFVGHTCDVIVFPHTGQQFRLGWPDCGGCKSEGYKP